MTYLYIRPEVKKIWCKRNDCSYKWSYKYKLVLSDYMKIAIWWGGNDSVGNDSLFDRRGLKALSMPICYQY